MIDQPYRRLVCSSATASAPAELWPSFLAHDHILSTVDLVAGAGRARRLPLPPVGSTIISSVTKANHSKSDHCHMNETDVIDYISGLSGVVAMTASEESAAPEVAWGDFFFYYDPDGTVAQSRELPFATLVIHDYPGWDTESHLDREGVFRVNVAIGRSGYERLLGHSPAEHADHRDEFDFTAIDVLLPHPVYAAQGWVSILNPAERTSTQLKQLLDEAHGLAVRRHARKQSGGGRS
jgi:Family of unknown function (DUF6194)